MAANQILSVVNTSTALGNNGRDDEGEEEGGRAEEDNDDDEADADDEAEEEGGPNGDNIVTIAYCSRTVIITMIDHGHGFA